MKITSFSRYVLETGLCVLTGLLLVMLSGWFFITRQLGEGWFIFVAMGVAGFYTICSNVKRLLMPLTNVIVKNAYFISLSKPAIINIKLDSLVKTGKVLLFLPQPVFYYDGEIQLFVQRQNQKLQLGEVVLHAVKPFASIVVPRWLRWLNVREAGQTASFWSKGKGRSFEPVVIPFENITSKEDCLLVRINIQNVVSQKKQAEAIDLVEIFFKFIS